MEESLKKESLETIREKAIHYRDTGRPFNLDKARKCIEISRSKNDTTFTEEKEITEEKLWTSVEEGDLLALSAVLFGMDVSIFENIFDIDE